MRIFGIVLLILSFILISFTNGIGQAFDKLEKAYQSGEITADEMILNKFIVISSLFF
jgi:Na+-transporting methylmalonyl-CoA/oxaloacetate decarboxylase gamma subunit